MDRVAGGDENLEIVFWWLESERSASIEDELDTYLRTRAPRRRRLLWPGRHGSSGTSVEL